MFAPAPDLVSTLMLIKAVIFDWHGLLKGSFFVCPLHIPTFEYTAVVSGKWSEYNLDSQGVEVTVVLNGLERSPPHGWSKLRGRVLGSWKWLETCLLVRLVTGI